MEFVFVDFFINFIYRGLKFFKSLSLSWEEDDDVDDEEEEEEVVDVLFDG